MYYELYLDVLFLENLLADYLLLGLLKRMLKCQAGRLRRMLGAAVGSLGVCGVAVGCVGVRGGYLLSMER